jgi:hypothetical protein
MRRWQDNIKIDIQKVGCERAEWMHFLAQGPVADSATTNPRILWKAKNSLTTWSSPTRKQQSSTSWHTKNEIAAHNIARRTAFRRITVIMAYIQNFNVTFVLTVHKKLYDHVIFNPWNRPWRPIGLWDVEGPTVSRQSNHWWRWGQPYAPAALYPRKDSWYSFLLEAELTPRQ